MEASFLFQYVSTFLQCIVVLIYKERFSIDLPHLSHCIVGPHLKTLSTTSFFVFYAANEALCALFGRPICSTFLIL